MDRGEQLSVLGGLAADQWGLVTAAQAKRAGLNGVQLKRLAEAGLLESVGHGVYLLTAAGQPQHLEIKVAWLRLQPAVPAWQRSVGDPASGVVSHASACQLHDLGDIPAPRVEISVPRRRVTTEPSVRLHNAALERSDTTLVDGLPVTTARRTILDLLRSKTDGGHVGGVIAEAERRDLISTKDLAEEVQPLARRYGMPPSADGRALIEHLVAQAGENLRSQQIERATQEGFNSALRLLASQQPQLDLSPALQATRGQNAAVVEAVRRAAASTVLSPELRRSLQALTRMPVANAAVVEAVRRAAATSVFSPELRRSLQALTQPNPALRRAIRAMQTAHAVPTSPQQAIEAQDDGPTGVNDQSQEPADGDADEP